MVAEGNSTAQPSVEQADASGVPSLPTPVIPPLIQTVGKPPNPGIQNPGAGATWYPEDAPFRGRGLPRGHKRTRHRGGGGRNPRMSYPRVPRGGGNTNPRNPGPADVSSRGNGGFNRNGWSQGYATFLIQPGSEPAPFAM